jgi:hypothetical protein
MRQPSWRSLICSHHAKIQKIDRQAAQNYIDFILWSRPCSEQIFKGVTA